MRIWPIIALAALGCSTPQAPEDADLPPTLHLRPLSALVRGAVNLVWVQATTPGARVAVAYDEVLDSVGTLCPPELGGDCLVVGMTAGVDHTFTRQDDGWIVVHLAVPNHLGSPAYLQAWSLNQHVYTDALEVPVLARDDDEDGDGLTNGTEVEHTHTDPLMVDTDGDGLSDGVELTYGSDPNNPDSDGDGVSDGEEALQGLVPGSDDLDQDGLTNSDEVLLHGTDPRRRDTDGDGLSDGVEVQVGTDPRDPDSDDDGVNDHDEVVLGADPWHRDTDGDGRLDGEEFLAGTSLLLADSDADGLDDLDEHQRGTDPLRADSDADGLDDGDEVNHALTDPLDPDTDGDGLRDGDEAAVFANPTLRDTDGDHLDDGLEVLVLGTRPNRADTDGGGRNDDVELAAGSDPWDPADDAALACPSGTVEDCTGACTTGAPADGTCDPTLVCPAFAGDGGDCPTASRTLPGTVRIPGTHSPADLIDVVAIGGALILEPTAPARVYLPHLQTAGSLVVVGGPAGTGTHVMLPALHTLAGDLSVHGAGGPVAGLDLPALATVGSVLQLDPGDAMVSLDLSSLAHARSVDITLDPSSSLGSVALPALTHADSLTLFTDGIDVDLPALATLDAALDLDAFDATIDLSALTSVPTANVRLRSAGVVLDQLAVVGTLTLRPRDTQPGAPVVLPALTGVTDLTIRGTHVGVDLPALTEVSGTLTWRQRSSGDLSAPLLTEVGQLSLAAAGDVQSTLPALHTVAGGTTLVLLDGATCALPALTSVQVLTLASEHLPVWSFPALQQATGIVATHPMLLPRWDIAEPRPPLSTQLTHTLYLPELQSLQALAIASLHALHTIDTPALSTADTHLVSLVDLPQLTSLDPGFFPGLQRVSLTLQDTGLAAPIELSSLTRGDMLRWSRNPDLPSVHAPVLEHISDTLEVEHNDALTALTFPALTTLGVAGNTIVLNPLLSVLDLSAVTDLGHVGSSAMTIIGNASLSQCELNAWALPFLGSVNVANNGPC